MFDTPAKWWGLVWRCGASRYGIIRGMSLTSKKKKKKDRRNVLAVYSLRDFACQEHFVGLLEEMFETANWHLDTVRPGRFFTEREFVNEDGEPFDGYILSMPGSDAAMKRIAASRTPTVLVNITDRRLSARSDAVASVWTDNADVGLRAAEHLLDRGEYKSAGYVHELGVPFYSTERMTAFRARMKRNGLATSVLSASDTSKDFSDRLREWVRDLPKPAAVMACSDMRAADVINACRAEGVSVPTQVAVVGVDNDAAQHAKCGMTISSVILNMRGMGRTAVRELDFLFAHPKWRGRPHEVLVPAKGVFAGESTARSVSAARLVNMAQAFIVQNLASKISPADVAAHLGCSRKLAELRFSQICGCTLHKAIEDARMDEVRRRLAGGKRVNDIVKEMRFTSANQLYRIYKRHFGRSIRQDQSS